MNFTDITAKWRALSTAKKWLTVGGVVVVLGVLSEGQNQADPDQGNAAQLVGGGYAQSNGGGGGYPQGQPDGGYARGAPIDANGGYTGGGYADGGYAAGGGYAAPAGGGGGGHSGTTDWEANQRAQSQAAAGFGQMINDTDTIRNNDTGEVYGGVTGDVAGAAVDSGAYTSVPTSELPVAGE
jgi:hypothetical protein